MDRLPFTLCCTLLGALALGARPPAAAAQPRTGFFADPAAAPLEVTITANMRQLRSDKMDDAPWRQATLAYAGADGQAVTVPARVRTRGNWRLKNCQLPPLRLNFNRQARGTAFDGVDRPKLVNPCHLNDDGDRWVLQEFQLYRAYNALTDHSPRARLLRVTYVDSASARPVTTRWAFLLEEDDSLAARLGAQVVEQRGATAEHLDPDAMVRVSVFQYLIGNTDWSINYLHNIILLGTGASYVPVAYDFDHAGAVNTRYARPPETLALRRVRDRMYRGYCAPADAYARVFAEFQARREPIYAVYRDSLGALLPPNVVRSTLEYFDEFYATIGDPGQAKRRIVDACLQ